MASIELRGDWRKLRHKFNRLSTLGQYMADEAIRDIAELVKKELHEAVNSSPPPPNAPSTVRRKGFNDPFKETGGFLSENSIYIDTRRDSDRTAYIVKGNPYFQHDRSEKSYEDILGILDKGSNKIPSRPVVEMTYDRLQREIESLTIKKARDYYDEEEEYEY